MAPDGDLVLAVEAFELGTRSGENARGGLVEVLAKRREGLLGPVDALQLLVV